MILRKLADAKVTTSAPQTVANSVNDKKKMRLLFEIKSDIDDNKDRILPNGLIGFDTVDNTTQINGETFLFFDGRR